MPRVEMSRRAKHLLIIAVVGVILVIISWALPPNAVFTLAGLGWGLGLAGLIARGRYGKARTLMARGQHEAAFDELLAFEKQLETDAWRRALAFLFTGFHTSNPVALVKATQGAVRLDQGRLVEAEALLEVAVRLDPGYALPWANRALVAASMGHAEAARVHAEKARSLGYRSAAFERALASPRPHQD